MISRAWYVRCDGPCGGNPAEVSTSSAAQARTYAMTVGYGRGDAGEDLTFDRRKVDGRMLDLCPACKILPDGQIIAWLRAI